MTPSYATGSELLGRVFDDLERGEPPPRYTVPGPFAPLDTRPGRLILFGGAPGAGKTAALLQIGVDLLRANPAARLLVANVEMAPALLVERILSRLSGVALTAIGNRELRKGDIGRLRAAVESFAPIAARLAFLNAPFALEHVAAAGTAFGANVLVLDYIQRITTEGGGKDKREQLETAATVLRRFCDAGALAIVASAVARQKHAGGSTYHELNLASFRGSSELEYGADAAYLLNVGDQGNVTFACEKNRHGPLRDILTRFDPDTQTFLPAPAGLEGFDEVPAAEPPSNGRRGKH